MEKLESIEGHFTHIMAAMEAAKRVDSSNELIRQTAADITRFAVEMVARRAFPETPPVEGE